MQLAWDIVNGEHYGDRAYPMTGVTASNTKTMIAIILEKSMTGHRRPRSGPSDSQTQVKEYTAVKAFPKVGYSFYPSRLA